jgi:hypothetical protein
MPFANMCFAAETAAATPPCWSGFEALYWRRAELWSNREGTVRKHAGHWRVEMAERVLRVTGLVLASADRAASPDM